MLEWSHTIEENVDIVSLRGRFTAVDSPSLSDALNRILEEGSKNLSLNMTELEFVDSSGLSAIVSTLKKARKEGGDLVLLNVNERIMALLKLTRLHEVIEIYDNEDTLLASFA